MQMEFSAGGEEEQEDPHDDEHWAAMTDSLVCLSLKWHTT